MPDLEFILLGDACWLDFVNTARGRVQDPPDLLPDPAAYHRWTRAEKLMSDVDEIPFSDVLALRRQLTALAEALSVGRQPPSSAVAAINAVLAHQPGCERLVRTSGRWAVRLVPERPPRALEVVARSAAATLADPGHMVRRCAAEPCSLFFLDGSTTQSRRWCSATACGGRGRIERRRGLLR
ncbi:MAG TPA: CGNR zinc finger domain-containing protein [Gemmatimonadales bacterium]|nr:CGNR zinc finger domain-containing protein [Gemmatimonadales bacterium]